VSIGVYSWFFEVLTFWSIAHCRAPRNRSGFAPCHFVFAFRSAIASVNHITSPRKSAARFS
jgi:hypothetical protein